MNIKFLILFILIYSLALGIRIFWLSQKDGFHLDEVLSITLACYNDYMWTKNYDFNVKFTGKEIKEMSLCDNDSIKNVFGDIYRLWNNNRDSPHTNLYYSFLRLSLAGLKTGDINKIIFRGGFLNLIFFTISFIIFFLIMKLLFPNSKIFQFSATLCTFLSTATISNTLFLRPYQIQETLFIIFCYFFFKTINNKKYNLYDKCLYINLNITILLTIVTAITLLTGYYAIIFIGIFGIYVIFLRYKDNNLMEIIIYFFIFCLSLIIAQLLYLRYIQGFFSYRSQETTYTLFNNFIGNLLSSTIDTISLMHKYYFSLFVVLICLLSLIILLFFKVKKVKINLQKTAIVIFTVSFIYSLIVIIIAPYNILRYIMSVFPFFIFLPLTIISAIGKQRFTLIIMTLLFIVFTIEALNENNIENINKNKPYEYDFVNEKDIPVFILNNTYWKYADLIPYFSDEQIYYFIRGIEDINYYNYDTYYIIFENTSILQDINFESFNVIQEFNISYFICKKISK